MFFTIKTLLYLGRQIAREATTEFDLCRWSILIISRLKLYINHPTCPSPSSIMTSLVLYKTTHCLLGTLVPARTLALDQPYIHKLY